MKGPRSRRSAMLILLSLPAGNAMALSDTTLAPGAPGKDAQWASAGKQAIGTSNTLQSKVWFTLQGGALTEVFYPTADVPNVHFLEFVVVNPPSRKVQTEREDANSQVQILSHRALLFRQINSAKNDEWKIIKTYTADPQRNTVLSDVQFETKNKALALYVYFDPSLNNSGMHDSAWTQGNT